jgi:hypothetical protein
MPLYSQDLGILGLWSDEACWHFTLQGVRCAFKGEPSAIHDLYHLELVLETAGLPNYEQPMNWNIGGVQQDEGAHITVNTLHPGPVRTKLAHLDGFLGFFSGTHQNFHNLHCQIN